MDLHFVPTNDQLAEIFTRPLTKEGLILLRNQLGMKYVNEWFNIYLLFNIASKDLSSNGYLHTHKIQNIDS